MFNVILFGPHITENEDGHSVSHTEKEGGHASLNTEKEEGCGKECIGIRKKRRVT